MINCPVCERKDIQENICPGCDTDLRPLLRIQGLPKVYYKKGEQFFEKGLLNESVENLLISAAFNPGYIEPLLILGKIYDDKKSFDDAIWFYKKALNIDPANEKANEELLRVVKAKEELKNNHIKKEKIFKNLKRLVVVVPVISIIMTVLLYNPVNNFVTVKNDSASVSGIADKIKENISNHPVLVGLPITVSVSEGSIVLHGIVPSILHKYLTDEVISNIDGIDKVDYQNKLFVEEPGITKFPYTVKKGDTLSLLAYLFYNSSSSWQLIFNANAETLKSPNELYAGMVIAIPIK